MRMTQKDTKGFNTPANYKGISPDANLSVNPFGQNRAAEIAYKKAERLILATHLVTNFVPKSESVRENIRNRSQQLLSKVMDLREGVQSTGSDSLLGVTATVRQILSLLDVIHASGYISNMNTEVLKGAYVDLITFLAKAQDGEAAEALVLEEGDFMSVTASYQGQKSKGQNEVLKDNSIKDIVTDKKGIKDIKAVEGKRPQSLRAKRRATSRRIAILDVVTKRSPIHIKDIAAEVTGCSEKTIQRELAGLVRDGVVKKEGSKRWTTYSLVM